MAHINELIDFVVTAYIVNNGKVLLILHKKLNIWLPIGGHIELDEDPEQALFREIKEECGLEVEVLSQRPNPNIPDEGYHNKFIYTPNVIDVHNYDLTGPHRHVNLGYFCTSKSDQVKLAEDEHNEIRWFSEEDLDDPKFKIIAPIKFLAKRALEAAK